MAERSCHDCAFCVWDKGLWLRGLWSGFPARATCANHPDTPGTLREVPPGGPCRNFRAKRQPPVRLEPPPPPDDTVRYIPLTKGKFAIVDAADYEWLSQCKWYAHWSARANKYYACRRSLGRTVFMHREIMKTPKGKVVDHQDGNGSDNRRANLRNCTLLQNAQNSGRHRSKVRSRGVYRRGDKYEAKVVYKDSKYYLGLFDDEVQAAKARDRKAYELVGEYAYLSFPEDFAGRRAVRARSRRRKVV